MMLATKKLKNGKVRLYRIISQAITSWRGSNDKAIVVREERHWESNYGDIITFNSIEDAQKYATEIMEHKGSICTDWEF